MRGEIWPTLEEYALPFRMDDLRLANELDSWFARFAGLQSDEITSILRDEWGAIRSPAVASFRDAIISFKPISLVYSSGDNNEVAHSDGCEHLDRRGWWLKMEHRTGFDERDIHAYLHAPPARDALIRWTGQQHFAENEAITEFCYHFYHLQNSLELGWGFYPPPWSRLEEVLPIGGESGVSLDKTHHPDPNREWATGFCIYSTASAEMVFLRPSGEVCWLLNAEGRIRRIGPSFSGFLEQCALCFHEYGTLEYYNMWDSLPCTPREEDVFGCT